METVKAMRETQYGYQLEDGSFVNATDAVKNWISKKGPLPALIQVMDKTVGPKGGISWGKVKYISPADGPQEEPNTRAPQRNYKPRPEFMSKEKTSDKALTMLVSYAKDIVCEEIKLLNAAATDNIEGLFKTANEEVWKSYDFFKTKLEAGQ